MKKHTPLRLTALLSFLLMTTLCRADLLDRGNYIEDTATGWAWYKTSLTAGLSYDQLTPLLDTTYSGYTLATESQLHTLFQSAGLPSSQSTYNIQDSTLLNHIRSLVDLLGPTATPANPWYNLADGVYGYVTTGSTARLPIDGIGFNLWVDGFTVVGHVLVNESPAAGAYPSQSRSYIAPFLVRVPPSLTITSLQTPTHSNGTWTFISTDPITLQATISPVASSVPVHWSVLGLQAAQHVSGFPADEVHYTDSQGVSTLTFKPSQNATFVQNRRSKWTTGSFQANPPIQFEVEAAIGQGNQRVAAYLSQTSLGLLQQDEIDTLRQEYVDFEINFPLRSEVVSSLGRVFNNGPYNVQLSVDLPRHYDEILAAYQGSSANYDGASYTIPTSARVIVSNAFRNPRYNNAIGSKWRNSKHCYGQALDLVPCACPIPLNSNGRATMPDLDQFWYPALGAAITDAGLGPLPEQGSKPLNPPDGTGVGDPRENHLHTQW